MQNLRKSKSRAPKATMADVASRAGVSAATVARVIYKNGYVKKDTREAVEAAVAETGYSPNKMARGLRTSRSFTLGMVVSESRLNAFHPAIAHVVQIEALRNGYTVLTLNNHADPAMETAGVRSFLDHHVDAIIFCSAIDPANVRLVASSGIPTVQVERPIADIGGVVTVDAEQGMRDAVDHLQGLGHRIFAYIGGEVDTSRVEAPKYLGIEVVRERLFRESLARHAITIDEAYILSAPYYDDGRPPRQPGHTLMRRLLALNPRPTAVVCGSDLLAASALQAISEAGLSVPHDISIIGYDDSVAEILTPALSSIAQPIEEMGKKAVTLALQSIDDPTLGDQTMSTSTSLVVRESTAKPPTPKI
ncbi:LacI family DNA-binding transcriptional regulator [Rhizobium leguminosarum]|uniref:LacI family DNA-binding transcriptional regulator n=1 Tax=Rhizobium leguminosarum TaxID=384 RepID=UPI003F9644A4